MALSDINPATRLETFLQGIADGQNTEAPSTRIEEFMSRIAERVNAIPITPQMFGAVGDGTADDKKAIQDALDNMDDNTVLFIPEGEYRITGTLYIKKSGSYIYGCGVNTKITKDFNGNMIENVAGSRLTDVNITDLYLYGNNKTGDGIHTYRDNETNTRCGAINIERVWVTYNGGVGINLLENYIARVVNCNVYNNGTGIHASVANGTYISTNEVYGNEYGIIVDGGSFAATIDNNTIQENTAAGVLLAAAYACSVTNNYFENNTGDTILLTKREGVDGDLPISTSIKSNYIACAGTVKPINVYAGNRSIIEGNYIAGGTQTAAIYLGSNTNSNVIGNNHKTADVTNLVDDFGYKNQYQIYVKKEITAEPDTNGYINTGLKFSDYAVISAYSSDRSGWMISPVVSTSSGSLSTSNWLIRIWSIAGSTPSGNFTIVVYALKTAPFITI